MRRGPDESEPHLGGPHATTRGPKFTRATYTPPSCTRARSYAISCYIYGKERGRSLSHLSSTGRRADNSRCGANATAAIDDVLLRFLELARTPLHLFYLPLSTITSLLCPLSFASFFPLLYSFSLCFFRFTVSADYFHR